MEYINVGKTEEFPENTCKLLTLPDGLTVLIVNVDGEMRALEGECSNGHVLEDAVVDPEAGKLLCPSFGWEIDLEESCCLAGPDCSIRQFPVRVEGDQVQISTA